MAWVLGAALTPAAAQPAADAQDAARALERIQREQQERQQRQFQLDRQGARPRTQIEIEVTPPRPGVPGGACVQASRIVITGATSLSASALANIQSRFQGRCLTVTDLEAVLAEITADYIARGRITARAYVNSQDASTGTIEIQVVEGAVESIRIEGSGVSLGTAFPGVAGEPLNLRDIEQGLDQTNRLGSNNATMDIEPGSLPGSSVVVIRNQPARRWRLTLSADNQGSTSTGRDQASASFSVDNPLGIGDFLSLTHRRTVPSDEARRLAIANSLSYVLPYGYNTFSLGISRSRYVTHIQTPGGQSLKANGDSDFASMTAERVLYRDQASRLSASATLVGKETKNFLAEQFLQVSSRRLTVLDLDANLSTGVASGVLGLALGYSKGLAILGAQKDPAGLPDEFPKAQFEKFRYGASFVLPLRAADLDWAFNTQWAGQYARDVLYGSEQISVGGIYSVRGFSDTSLSGNSGWTLRNELSVRVPIDFGAGNPALLRPYLALDHGRVTAMAGTTGGALVGAAAGASLSVGSFYFDIFSAKPIAVAHGMRREKLRTYLSVRIAI